MKRYALFTCDTEFTPPWYAGSWGNQEKETFQGGIRALERILGERGVRGTFYCQGTMVEEFPDIVQGLAKRHLIGSHGYNHENYGGRLLEAFFTAEPMPLADRKKKAELLEKCMRIHTSVVGYKPEVFCAPFNSIDTDMLGLLEQFHIKVDSSFNNYRLGLPTALFKPQSFDLYELPFSIVRVQGFGYTNVLQALTYDYTRAADVLKSNVVFITCHPYEFIDIRIPHPRHVLIVGDEKVRTLARLIDDLTRAGYEFVDPLKLLDAERCEAAVR